MCKIALIAGVRGQDGSYLADKLLLDGWNVVGITRGTNVFTGNIAHLAEKIDLLTSDYSQKDILRIVQQSSPHVIFNLAGQTYVSKSWVILDDTIQSAAIVPMYFLDAILKTDKNIRYFQASSSEIYQPNDGLLTETSPIGPINPYGCSKAFSHHLSHAYRTHHNLYASTGILFNHESPRRAYDFLSRKVVREAVKIKKGVSTSLALGNLDIERDWGYAPDYMLAIVQLMELDGPEDINICTGKSRTVYSLAETVFRYLNIDLDLITSDTKFFRSYEPISVVGSNSKAKCLLGWSPLTTFEDMMYEMVEHELRRI